jgi:YD repeat-containing protein
VTDKLKLWDPNSTWEWYGVSDSTVWYWKNCDARHPTPSPGPPYYYSDPGVEFRCGVGYSPVPGGRCVVRGDDYPQGPTNRCQTDNGGHPNPSTPHPIDILTGSKMLRATDFVNVNRSLLLERFFVSGAYSGTSDPVTGTTSKVVVGLPNTLANWTFGFSYELQIPDNWPSPPRVTVLTPTGSAYVFERNSDGSMSPYRPAARPLPQTDYQLSLIGTWPSNLTTLKTAASSWKLTGPDGETILLTTQAQKSDDPNNPMSSQFLRARPTKITQRSGLAWSFRYGSLGELTQLTDSYGNLITFEWLVHSTPRAITAANLPNGYKILYVYGSAVSGTVPDIDRLIRVEYLDDQGVVRDKTIYRYADANHPTFVTRVEDLNSTKRWEVTYDTLGRATKSAATLGVDSYQVGYGPAGSTFTRTVTNPLGKQAIYTFQRSSSTVYDQQLTRIEGQPSANCPWVGASTFTYDASGFLASITDEEGHTTAFTRSSRGFPTRVTEAQGTTVERTANLSWSAALRLPTRIDQSGSSAIDYDYQSGNLLHLTATDETTFTVPYATNGRTRVWTYGWSPTGQLLTADGPLPGTADSTTYSYDPATGYLQSITNPLGQVTQVATVDWRGAPTSFIDPNGINFTASYDIHGRLLTATAAPGAGQSL